MKFSKSNNPKSVSHPSHGSEKVYYCAHAIYKKGWFGRKVSQLLKRFNQIIFHVNIPPSVQIGQRLELAHGGFGIVMHSDTVIGDDAIIFHNVTIGNGGARIGDRVYLGAGAVIIGAVKIGDDVVIGANTVVNFDVSDGHTVVGPKAKLLKKV